MSRRLPLRSWIGLLTILGSELGMLLRVEPFYSWHTPIAWTGYILLVDGIVWKRRGSSWLGDARAEFAFLALMSIPLWVVFEIYNAYSLRNWHYVGLPDHPALRYFGYAWSFATISPAIFQTGELVATFRRPGLPQRETVRRPQQLGAAAWASVAAGAAMLAGSLLFPSPYLAAPVFLGFAFLLDPLNARSGSEALLADFRHGQYDRLFNLLVAGLICGLLWEFWNYWAGAKWIYTVPILPEVKLFEMPILGFGGFPPFAVECFTMYVAVRRLCWRRAGRPISV